MQRLFSLKSLSKPSKHFPISPFLNSNPSQTSISLLSKNPGQLTRAPFLHSPSISNSFRPWRPSNICFRPFSAGLKEPIISNYKTLNTHLSVQGASFFRWVIRDMRERFRRHGFELGRSFEVHRNYWRFRIPTVEAAVLGLIGANVAVFILWRTVDPIFMTKNFMISWNNFVSGRIHTLITSAFSQRDSWHLFSNMLGLYFFGNSIGRLFGPEFLVKLYLAGAIGGSIFYLAHKAISSSRDVKYAHGLGASGAVNAIVLLEIFLFPKAVYYVNFFIPVPAMLLGAIFIGKDIHDMMTPYSGISGEGHLGGAVVAALAWARIRKGWI